MLERLITVALNGPRKMPSDHPRLPMAPDAIACEARLAADAGAALLHLHVRARDGSHSLDPAQYREAMAAVRDTCDDRLMIQITTESAGIFEWDTQVKAVTNTQPDAASVALRELCPSDAPQHRAAYADFIGDCLASDTWLQHILYDENDVYRFKRFCDEGVYGNAPFVLLVVGRYGGPESSSPEALDAMADDLLAGVHWAACAFGQAETTILDHALARGGHVRVGFENNLLHADGTIAKSNSDRVSRIAGLVHARNLTVMTRAEIPGAFGPKTR